MTLSDRITDVTRILTEWPEAERLAGVLRVVRAMGEDVDQARCEVSALEDACDREREKRKIAERERDAHRAHAGEVERTSEAAIQAVYEECARMIDTSCGLDGLPGVAGVPMCERRGAKEYHDPMCRREDSNAIRAAAIARRDGK